MQEYPVFSTSFARVGETMYFGATDGVHGRELWRTKAGAAPGTLAGAEMVADLSPGGFPSDPGDFFAAPDGSLYFKGNTPALGAELYRLAPGAGAVPQLVSDFNPGAANSAPLVVGAIGGAVYIWANDATGTAFMWRYNPTTGTLAKMTGSTGEVLTRPGKFTMMGGFAYFAADTSSNGVELWRTDGSSTTAQLVKDVTGDYRDSYPTLLTSAGNTLYFFAQDPVTGNELWKSDGTTAGTTLVADLTPGWNATTYNAMFAVNGVVYFDTPAGTSQDRLWRSDGTAAGTYELAPLQNPRQFTTLNGQLYFAADDAQGRAVFRYDPSNPATAPVRLTPTTTGNFALRPTALYAAGTRVYFVALAGTGRGDHYELWQTDGSTGGTKKIRDVQPVVSSGTTPSLGTYFVSGFYALGANSTHLFFPAWTPELGQELYALPLVDPAGAIRGSVFDDRNRNGVRDAGEPGLAGRTVFADLDNDGAIDDAEPVATTDANGNYALTALDPGTYALRQVVPAGWLATGAADPRGATVAAAPIDGINFGSTDVAPPTIQGGVPAPERPDSALRFTFSEDVGASLSPADLRIVAVPGGAALDPSKFAVSFDPATLTATFTFPGYPGGRLPDGNYRATLLAGGVTDPTGNPAAADYALDFYVLGGDTNRDRVVNFNDLLLLASNYNKAGLTYAQGDFTGDGVVNFNDLLILAQNYNKSLPAPALPPEPVAASAAPLGSAALAVATADPSPADRTKSQSKVFNVKTPITRPAPAPKPVKAAKGRK
jgi:ELWxxDGT repeat protein